MISMIYPATAACVSSRTSTLGYALQLVLSALQKLLDSSGADGTATAAATLEVEAVVTAAREAPDGAVRNAALGLLTVLARAQPQRTLQHILQVCLASNTHWKP